MEVNGIWIWGLTGTAQQLVDAGGSTTGMGMEVTLGVAKVLLMGTSFAEVDSA